MKKLLTTLLFVPSLSYAWNVTIGPKYTSQSLKVDNTTSVTRLESKQSYGVMTRVEKNWKWLGLRLGYTYNQTEFDSATLVQEEKTHHDGELTLRLRTGMRSGILVTGSYSEEFFVSGSQITKEAIPVLRVGLEQRLLNSKNAYLDLSFSYDLKNFSSNVDKWNQYSLNIVGSIPMGLKSMSLRAGVKYKQYEKNGVEYSTPVYDGSFLVNF